MNRELKHDDYYPISDEILASLDRYVNQGIEAGGFLNAVLENNLAEACGRADIYNKFNLHNIVGYIYNNIPYNSWGSKEKVKSWIELQRNINQKAVEHEEI